MGFWVFLFLFLFNFLPCPYPFCFLCMDFVSCETNNFNLECCVLFFLLFHIFSSSFHINQSLFLTPLAPLSCFLPPPQLAPFIFLFTPKVFRVLKLAHKSRSLPFCPPPFPLLTLNFPFHASHSFSKKSWPDKIYFILSFIIG